MNFFNILASIVFVFGGIVGLIITYSVVFENEITQQHQPWCLIFYVAAIVFIMNLIGLFYVVPDNDTDEKNKLLSETLPIYIGK